MRTRDPVTGRIVSSVVCGRKFCTRCGRWKHLCYFRPRRRQRREYPQSECDGCHNRSQKQARKTATGNRRAHRQEYERIYTERRRRAAGAPPRNFKDRHGAQLYHNRVDPALFLEWMHFIRPMLTETEARRIREYTSGAESTLDLGTIDSVMTRYGAADQFFIFYGDCFNT